MKVNDLCSVNDFKPVCQVRSDREISKVFCCDLLSIAMSKAPAGSCWITIMGNINSLAVASLTDCACIVFAEGVMPDDTVIHKAEAEGIPLFSTALPIFEAGLLVNAGL